jgi:hypothetical protein
MKFIYADNLDCIDPGYDFATDSHSAGRQVYWDDQYPHEYMRTPPYDGILVSRAIVGDHRFPGRYTSAQSMRFRRVGARKFLRFDGPTCIDRPMYGDCGAFSYVNETEPPYTPEEMLEFYVDAGFTYGCSVDHVIFEFERDSSVMGGSVDSRRRYEITLANAEEFLKLSCRFPPFTPLGVVQGWSPASKAEAARRLEAMGYRYLAVGGMVPLNAKSIHLCLDAIRSRIRCQTRLHLLGFAKADEIGEFVKYDIESFDSTSPLLRAFKDASANYYVLRSDGKLDYYSAIRIPQSLENTRMMRAAKEGRYNQEDLVKLECHALTLVRAYDRGEVAIEAALAAMLAYSRVFMWDERRTQEKNERALELTAAALTRTLNDRPWKCCSCRVCQSAGVEVAIFRSSNRNKRRGFHNLGVYYEYVRRQIDVSHAATDLELPSHRRTAEP